MALDLAFFSLDFFSSDRGSDLGRVKSSDALSLEHGESFLVNQAFGKSLRGNAKNVFGVKPIPSSPYCPVKNLTCVSLAGKMMEKLSVVYESAVSTVKKKQLCRVFQFSSVNVCIYTSIS